MAAKQGNPLTDRLGDFTEALLPAPDDGEARDPLTGLASGAALHARLRERVERERRPAALAVIDLDNFEEVNDRLGRVGGDAALREVGAILGEAAGAAGRGGVAARLRGDEFALLLPGRDTDEAFAVVEEARRRVAAARIGAGEGRPEGITISAGIAASPRDATGVIDLHRKAEDGLWRAKKGSRNRIGLPSDERMVLKTTYYAPGQLERLDALKVTLRTTEASLLREALDDLLRKYADHEKR